MTLDMTLIFEGFCSIYSNEFTARFNIKEKEERKIEKMEEKKIRRNMGACLAC